MHKGGRFSVAELKRDFVKHVCIKAVSILFLAQDRSRMCSSRTGSFKAFELSMIESRL